MLVTALAPEIGYDNAAKIAKHAHAHLAAGRLLALAEKAGRMAQILLQGCAFIAHKFGIVLKPCPCGTGSFRQFAAVPR